MLIWYCPRLIGGPVKTRALRLGQLKTIETWMDRYYELVFSFTIKVHHNGRPLWYSMIWIQVTPRGLPNTFDIPKSWKVIFRWLTQWNVFLLVIKSEITWGMAILMGWNERKEFLRGKQCPKETQCQRMFKLLHNYTHLTH